MDDNDPVVIEESMDDFMSTAFDGMGSEEATEIESPDDEVTADIAADDGAEVEVNEDTADDAGEVDEVENAEPEGTQTITAPQSMSAKDREKFYALPPDQQQFISERVKQQEADYTKKTMELAEQRKSFDKLEQVIAPRRQQLALDGMDEGTAVGQLFALSDFANQDPVGFVQYLFQQRGIPLSALTNQSDDGQPVVDPQLAAMQSELHGLKNHFTQQAQASEQAKYAAVSTDIESFSKDPQYPFYAELENDMIPLVAGFRQSNPGLSNREYLAKAYKAAIAVNDDVSAKIAADNSAKAEAARIAKAKKDADKAKRAGSTNIRSSGALPQGAAKAKSEDDFIGAIYDDMMTA
jgi:hypothetical protein